MSSIKGSKHSEEAKLKMSLAHKGKKLSEEHKERIKLTHARPFLGKQFSKQHRDNIAKKRIGMKFTDSHIQNMRKPHPSIRGEKNPAWKGDAVNKKRAIDRNSYEATLWKRKVFERDNYTCQICFQYSGFLHVDHIKKFADYPELRHDVDNGRVLCVPCHYYVTFKRRIPDGSKWGLGINNKKTYKEC